MLSTGLPATIMINKPVKYL